MNPDLDWQVKECFSLIKLEEGSLLWVCVRAIEKWKKDKKILPSCNCVKCCFRSTADNFSPLPLPQACPPAEDQIWRESGRGITWVCFCYPDNLFFCNTYKASAVGLKHTAHPLRQSVHFLTKHMPYSWRECKERWKRLHTWGKFL
jgi:hypothetical protein